MKMKARLWRKLCVLRCRRRKRGVSEMLKIYPWRGKTAEEVERGIYGNVLDRETFRTRL